MKINAAGLALVKEFEGCFLDAYICPSGVLTIGYGHTNDVKQGSKIAVVEAERLLKEDLKYFEQGVAEWAGSMHVALNQFEFAACVSLAFNIGMGNFSSSTVANELIANDRSAAANAFLMWVQGDGEVLPGLQRRRQAERDLFLTKVTTMNSTANFTLTFKSSSWLKTKPVDSGSLGAKEAIAFSKNAILNVAAIAFEKENGHHLITLGRVNGKQLEYLGRNTLWVFGKDVEVAKGGKLYLNNPVDSIGAIGGAELFIPSVGKVGGDTSIISKQAGGGFLTWGMATHGGTRIPNIAQTTNIVGIALRFERDVKPVLQQHTKQEIYVTSWFRPEPFNSQAGGVSNSQHLHGGAIDFWVDPLSSIEVYRIFDATFSGSLGRYANGITHIDGREGRARWEL